MLDGEPIQQQTIREIEVEKFITHRAERKYKHTLNDHMGRSSQRADREHRTWDTWFIRISGWIGLGSPKLVTLNQKYRLLFSLMVVLSDTHKGKVPGGRESQVLLGKSYQELTFSCHSADV